MARYRLSLLVFVVSALLALSLGCGDKKKESKEVGEEVPAIKKAGEPECKTNADCQSGWVCLASKCADPTLRGVGTGNAVTPDKVKKQVEDVAKQADERGQKALDM